MERDARGKGREDDEGGKERERRDKRSLVSVAYKSTRKVVVEDVDMS